jgi:glycosyltransferase involved in cell wall biosynthesis
MCPVVDFVIINDTRSPRTGGDYVYVVMKNELIRHGYKISEISIPLLIDYMRTRDSTSWIGHTFLSAAEIMANFWCYMSSLKRFIRGSHIIVTSSCPIFPVFGHVTYHQPKAGILTDFSKESDGIGKKIAYKVQENEMFSPMWLFVKRLIKLHLSNSKFTRELVKRIYGVDSNVLYPPVPVSKYLHSDFGYERKPFVLISRPEAVTGISLLPQIASSLPKNLKFIIIGKIDHVGIKALHDLKGAGAKFEYLGYVKEELKMEIFRKCSVYLNLAVNETFGITVVEALASGCVPIAHNSGSIPEYLPSEFRYSNINEAAERVAMHINSENDLRKELTNIALKFDEIYFRRRFMVFMRRLETWLGAHG